MSDEKKIVITPFDPTAEEKFQSLKKQVQSFLGDNIPVEHHGATSLGISGQDEIDTYIPVSPTSFNGLIEPLKELFGEPQSGYPLERIHYVTEISGKHIDVFLMNNDCVSWKNGMKFESYLRHHPDELLAYKDLKENGHGLTVRKYYKGKVEFLNDVIAKARGCKLDFKPISSIEPGKLFEILKSAYASVLEDDSAHKEQYLESWQKFDNEVFDNPDTVGKCVLVSFFNEKIVGFFSYDPRQLPEYGIIGQNCILPEFRGHGFGKEQIAAILNIFKERGAKKAVVTTGDSQFYVSAQKTYESLGFTEVSRSPKDKWGYGEIHYEKVL